MFQLLQTLLCLKIHVLGVFHSTIVGVGNIYQVRAQGVESLVCLSV